jgi:hypothetical protein
MFVGRTDGNGRSNTSGFRHGFFETTSLNFPGESLVNKNPSMINPSLASAPKRAHFGLAGPLALVAFCCWTSAAQAVQYDFLSVSGNWPQTGNAAATTFSSNNLNGTITVSHFFSSPAAVGYADNDNALIYPSDFSSLFPGTGQVQGHLAMTVYGDPNGLPPGGNINTSQVIFNLTTYTGSLPDLIFGIWNTTTEVGSPVYNVQLRDSSNAIVSPSGMSVYGNADNTGFGQVLGLHKMLFTPSTGDISFSNAILNASGIHTDAMFLKGIPLGTKEIIVTANLPPLNTIGDGVGYYFVEQVVPIPAAAWLFGSALGLIGFARRRTAA